MAAPTRPTPQKAAAAKQAAPAAPAAPPEVPKEPRAPRGRGGMLVPAVVVAVALLAAAFMLKGGGGGGSGASTPATTAPATAAIETGDPAEVVALDAITLNLADGRFLKLGVALQLAPGITVADPASFGARALDQTIELMGGYTYKDLTTQRARSAAKDKLSKAVSEAYDGDVLGVYFTEFVMQ